MPNSSIEDSMSDELKQPTVVEPAPLARHLKHMPRGTILSDAVYDDAKAQGMDMSKFIREGEWPAGSKV